MRLWKQAILDFVDLAVDEEIDDLYDDRTNKAVGVIVNDDRANDRHER